MRRRAPRSGRCIGLRRGDAQHADDGRRRRERGGDIERDGRPAVGREPEDQRDERGAQCLAGEPRGAQHAARAAAACARRGRQHRAIVRRLKEPEARAAQRHPPDDVEGARMRADRRERQQPGREQRKADAAEDAGRIAVRQHARKRRGEHDDERPRCHVEPRFDLRETERILQPERQRDEREHLRRKRRDRRADRQREHRDAHQVDRQQRRRLRQLAFHEEVADDERDDQFGRDIQAAFAVAETVDGHDQQPEHARVHQRARDVVRRVVQWVRRQRAHAAEHGRDADRHVHREQPRPRCERQDRGRHRRPDRRRQRDDHRIDRQPAPEHRRRIDHPHERRVHAHDAGRAEALDHAHHGQRRQRAGQRAAERGSGEQREAGDVDAAVADPFTERRERQQRDRDRELIRVDDPDRSGIGGMQVARDRRQRDVGDRAVEHGKRDAEGDADDRPVALRKRQAGIGVHGGSESRLSGSGARLRTQR